jgi:hypothetical protein
MDAEVIIAIAISDMENPSLPLSGVIATIASVEKAVKKAPKISGAKFFSLGRHGLAGFTRVLISPS